MHASQNGRPSGDQGFTLIEVLVVILIIGILAALAIPTLTSQRAKATDAGAKELARTGQTMMETIGTDNSGSYAAVSAPADLAAIEGTININSTSGSAYLDGASGSARSWTLEATSTSTGNRFQIARASDSSITRTCFVGALGQRGGCPVSGGPW